MVFERSEEQTAENLDSAESQDEATIGTFKDNFSFKEMAKKNKTIRRPIGKNNFTAPRSWNLGSRISNRPSRKSK